MKRCLGFFAILIAFVSAASAQEDYTQWSSFKPYRVNTTATGVGTQLAQSVLKFPLLIRLGAADSNVFKQTKLVAGVPVDLRFVKSDGIVRLKHQVERWDSAGRTAEVWVLLDTLYNNNNARTTRMYWGNAAAADSSNGTAVFDTALGDQAVWHMNATAAANNENDATINGFTATQNNTINLQAAGAIGRARTFTGGSTTAANEGGNSGTAGSNEYFRVANSATGKLNFPANGRYTISAWVRPTGALLGGALGRVIVSKHDRQYSLKLVPGANIEGNEYNNNRGPLGHATGPWGYQKATSPTAAAASQWIHVATVRDTLTQRLYVNGNVVATNLGTADSNYTAATDTTLAAFTDSVVTIGRQSETTNRYWAGDIDEVRMSNVARSANYIRMSYETQRPDQIAVSALTPPAIAYADSVTAEAGYAMASITPSLVSGFPAVTFSVAPALPAGLALNTATGVISGVPTAASSLSHVITATNSEGTGLDTVKIIVTAASEANYSAWTGTKTLTLSTTASGAGVATGQPLFPVLVRLTASGDSAVFAQAKAGGADLRFSRPNGTRLRYQIEDWNATAKTASIWVQVDNVAGNAANDIRMHWGNASANSQSTGSGTFPTAGGYQAVWHMNAGGTGNELDATANGFTATAFGAPLDSAGAVGRARQFNGTSQFFSAAGTASGTLNFQMTDSYSFSTWFYADTVPAVASSGVQLLNKGDNQYTIAAYDNAAAPKYWEITTRGNNTYLQARSNGTPNIPAASTIKGWHHLVGTYRGAAVGQAVAETLYFDGVRINALAATNTNNTGRNLTYDVHIGALAGGTAPGGSTSGATFTRYFVGRIDELQMANTVRSADWVKLSYKTQKPGVAPISNLVYSTPAPSYAAGAAITANTPSVRGPANRYAISPALPAGLAFNDTTGVITGTPSATGSGVYTVTAWSDSAWTTSTTLNITVGIPNETYSQWAQKRDLFINTAIPNTTIPSGAGVMSTVLKFPLLVRLDSANFATGFTQATKTGIDIRFTKPGDVVRLPHQIERWDSAGRKADIWVLVDSVKPNLRNQLIRMHWQKTTGGAAVDASSGSSVFGSANEFLAVWHMNDSASLTDASGNGNAAAPSAAAPTHNTTSLIGAGKTFNGSTNWYTVGTDASALNLNTNTGPYTISAWVNPSVAGCGARIAAFAKYQNSNNAGVRQYALHTSAGFEWRLTNAAPALVGNGDAEFTADASGSCLSDTWTLITGTYKSGTPTADSAANARIYVNGALSGTGITASVTGTSIGNTSTTFIGRISNAERYMNGSLDEITVSSAQRDTSWIKLAYATQRPGANTVVHTTAPVAIGTAEARVMGSSALAVKALGRGLLFQVQSEKAGTAQVSLLDVQGRTVWSRKTGTSAGVNAIAWDGLGNNGQDVSSGVYVVEISLLDADSKAIRTMRKTVPFTP